jgi:hypothetical protein
MKQTNINIEEIKRFPTVTNPISAPDLNVPQAYAYSLRRAIVIDCNQEQRAELVELLSGKNFPEGVCFNNTKANRERYHAVLNENIEEICADIARHDDRETISQLADLGFINEGNLERVIAAVNRLQDAAMTGFLLEMKRVRFGARAFDFDL